MKRNCEQFVEDISAFASDTAGLSAEAAAHIQNCARCREKLGELQAVAAMHREAAGNLAEPKRHLDRLQLERALTSAGSRRRNFEIRWRPVLGGAVALALIIGGVVTSRTPRASVEAGHRIHRQREQRSKASPPCWRCIMRWRADANILIGCCDVPVSGEGCEQRN
jgi:hypothetical protein